MTSQSIIMRKNVTINVSEKMVQPIMIKLMEDTEKSLKLEMNLQYH